jgi:putative tricarboxylic transport membrane protein
MAGFMNLFCGWMGLRAFIRVLGCPRTLLYPMVMFTCMIGAYLADNSIFCTLVMLILAVLGFFMRKFGYSFVTFLIGFVLGPGFEMSLQQSLTISGDSLSIFYTRPIPIICALLSLFMIYRIYRQWKKEKNSDHAEEADLDLS